MYTKVEKPKKNNDRAVANSVTQKKNFVKQGFSFMDNRHEAIAQRKLQDSINNSELRKHTVQLHESFSNKCSTIQCINSADLTLSQHNQVAKAPNGMGVNRFSNAGTSIHQVKFQDFPVAGGTIVDGDDSGARVDKQGDFNDGGKNWANVQVQANRTEGGADYADLTYPEGTPAAQRGTSFAEVHVDNRIVGSEKPDVINRGQRLLKQGLMRSRGDRNTYPRHSYRITY